MLELGVVVGVVLEGFVVVLDVVLEVVLVAFEVVLVVVVLVIVLVLVVVLVAAVVLGTWLTLVGGVGMTPLLLLLTINPICRKEKYILSMLNLLKVNPIPEVSRVTPKERSLFSAVVIPL